MSKIFEETVIISVNANFYTLQFISVGSLTVRPTKMYHASPESCVLGAATGVGFKVIGIDILITLTLL